MQSANGKFFKLDTGKKEFVVTKPHPSPSSDSSSSSKPNFSSVLSVSKLALLLAAAVMFLL